MIMMNPGLLLLLPIRQTGFAGDKILLITKLSKLTKRDTIKIGMNPVWTNMNCWLVYLKVFELSGWKVSSHGFEIFKNHKNFSNQIFWLQNCILLIEVVAIKQISSDNQQEEIITKIEGIKKKNHSKCN